VRVGRDFCSLPIGALIAARRSLILQRSADRVPGDYLEERVEQRRQADVHIQNRPLYFLLSLHPRIYRSPRNTFSSHHASIIISSIRSLFSIGSSTRHSLAQRTRRHPRTQLFFLFFIFFYFYFSSPTLSRRRRRSRHPVPEKRCGSQGVSARSFQRDNTSIAAISRKREILPNFIWTFFIATALLKFLFGIICNNINYYGTRDS